MRFDQNHIDLVQSKFATCRDLTTAESSSSNAASLLQADGSAETIGQDQQTMAKRTAVVKRRKGSNDQIQAS